MRSTSRLGFFGARISVVLTLALTLSGCATLQVADTVPLPPGKLQPLGAERISRDGYRLDALPAPPDAPDLVVLVAMSGGGKRSAAFAYGALKGMREIDVRTARGPRPLLDELSGIAGVSGGSFTAAYYGLYRDQAFGRFETDFLYRDTNSYVYGIYLLPWNWTWLVEPYVGTNDFMGRVYDRTMFHGATFADLQAKGRPLIGIVATDISSGTPFLFTQENFDAICSDLSALPISRAVAASNGFPGLFSPVTLTNHAKECGGRTPGWLGRVDPAELTDPLSRAGVEARRTERYLDEDRTRYVHLSDGGVSDNLAMRSLGNQLQVLSAGDLGARGYSSVRRVLLISIDGQGAQDLTVSQRRGVGGLFALLGLVSGGQIDNYNFETLTVLTQQLARLQDTLRAARCAKGPSLDGVACDDVKVSMVHIALEDQPPGPTMARVREIPKGTSLTLRKQDIDALIAAGREAVLHDTALRAFLDDY